MFTDLVGSTALSTMLDPEDMRSMIGGCHKCVAETIARFDGFVAKYMGDGVLSISAIRRPTSMMPSVQFGRDWPSSRRGYTRFTVLPHDKFFATYTTNPPDFASVSTR